MEGVDILRVGCAIFYVSAIFRFKDRLDSSLDPLSETMLVCLSLVLCFASSLLDAETWRVKVNSNLLLTTAMRKTCSITAVSKSEPIVNKAMIAIFISLLSSLISTVHAYKIYKLMEKL